MIMGRGGPLLKDKPESQPTRISTAAIHQYLPACGTYQQVRAAIPRPPPRPEGEDAAMSKTPC